MEIQHRLGTSKHPTHTELPMFWGDYTALAVKCYKQHTLAAERPNRPTPWLSIMLSEVCRALCCHSILPSNRQSGQCSPMGTHGSENSIDGPRAADHCALGPGLSRQSPWEGKPTAWQHGPASEQCLQILVICHTKQFTSICHNHVRQSNFAEPFC